LVAHPPLTTFSWMRQGTRALEKSGELVLSSLEDGSEEVVSCVAANGIGL